MFIFSGIGVLFRKVAWVFNFLSALQPPVSGRLLQRTRAKGFTCPQGLCFEGGLAWIPAGM